MEIALSNPSNIPYYLCAQVPLLKSGWERQSQQKRRWKCISFFRGYSHEENLNLSGVERCETPAALQHCYRWPSHSELWPQAFLGLFPSFKHFQESKATRTAQTWMPTPWPPPALSRYNRHPPASLCSEPGAFCFCRKDFSKLLSSDADWLICSLLFLGNAHTLSGSRHSQYQLLMGLGSHVFMSIPRSKISCVEEKTQVSWNCKWLNCVAMPNKKHFGFQLALSCRQPFGRCVRQQVLFQNIDCYFTNPCLMAASAAVRQDGCFKSLLNAKILNWSFMAGVVAIGPAACEL